MDLAGVTVLGQRRDGDIRDVLCVGERFRHIADRKCDHTGPDPFYEERLAEVLRDEPRPHDGPLRTRLPHRLFAPLGLGSTAVGKQDKAPDAASHREVCEGTHDPSRARERRIRIEGHISRVRAPQCRFPRGVVLPVERRLSTP
ncbi:hypothetical protein [Streptomyces sporangiiformans]|uniref:hypothetical protein n=1 Tax=Streptomyces sporangiiformans TaxID=2315329 RepID=UPI0030B8963C